MTWSGDAAQDFLAPPLQVIVGPDANRGYVILRSDNVLERVDELLGEAPMGDQDDSDHLIPKVLCCRYAGKPETQ